MPSTRSRRTRACSSGVEDLPHRIEERERATEVGGIDLGVLLADRVEHAGLERRVPADRPDLLDDQGLDLVRRDGRVRAGRPALLLRASGRGSSGKRVVPAPRVARGHRGVAGRAAEQPREERRRRAARPGASRACASRWARSSCACSKTVRVHDRRVLAVEVLALEPHAPDVDRVREELPERVLGPRDALAHASPARGPGLRLPAARVERLDGARSRSRARRAARRSSAPASPRPRSRRSARPRARRRSRAAAGRPSTARAGARRGPCRACARRSSRVRTGRSRSAGSASGARPASRCRTAA